MKIVYGRGSLEQGPKGPKALAIGVFDGVHRGHQKILKVLRRVARQKRLASAVVTFEAHPARALLGQAPVLHLTSLRHKLELLGQAGVGICYVMDFTPAFARLKPEVFLNEILSEKIGMRALVVGEDFVFGHGASGDVAFLRRAAQRKKFFFKAVPQESADGAIVSSTRIRRLIAAGELERARRLLGRSVSLFGEVVRGDARGRCLGFPTANLKTDHEAIPPDGIYATLACSRGRWRKSVTYIGTRPTFARKRAPRSIEVHIFDFKKNIYGKPLEIAFIKKIRPDIKFPDTSSLTAQMKKDALAAQKFLKHFSFR